MSNLALSAWLESYRSPLKQAFALAARDGFALCSVSTLRDDLRPQDFNPSAQRHLLRHVRDVGLQLDGLTAAYADRGLANPQRAEARLEHLLATLKMTREMGLGTCQIATAGLDPERPDPLVCEALARAGEMADAWGIRLTLQPSATATSAALRVVRDLGCPALGITLDTADLSLPRSGLEGLVGSVLLRDVRQVGGQVEEVEYGTGQVDVDALLGTLARADYDGPLTLRRDAGDTSAGALRSGRTYLQELMKHRDLDL